LVRTGGPRLLIERHAEAVALVEMVLTGVAPKGAAGVPGVGAPAHATYDARLPALWSGRIGHGLGAERAGRIVISAILIGVAEHVVETPRIRLQRADTVRPALGVLRRPGVFPANLCVVAPEGAGFRARPA